MIKFEKSNKEIDCNYFWYTYNTEEEVPFDYDLVAHDSLNNITKIDINSNLTTYLQSELMKQSHP